MIGHTGDHKTRWSLATFRWCPIQFSRAAVGPDFPSYRGDVDDVTIVPGGTENTARPHLTHDWIWAPPMAIYLTPPNRGHPHHQQLYFISYKHLKQCTKSKWQHKSADVKTAKQSNQSRSCVTSLKTKVHFRTSGPWMFSQRVAVTGRQVLLAGQELKTFLRLMRFVFKACSCALLFICMWSIVHLKEKEKNSISVTVDPDLPAGPVHVLVGPCPSMMDWFPLTASMAAPNWTWGTVVWMLAVLKKITQKSWVTHTHWCYYHGGRGRKS